MIILLLLVTTVSVPQAYEFAEDVPLGAGYSVVLRLETDDAGNVTRCTPGGVHELTPGAAPVQLKPSGAYVSDACRKLGSSRAWKPGQVFYFCRYLPDQPDKAFCESRFGR